MSGQRLAPPGLAAPGALVLLLERGEIARGVRRLAAAIQRDYHGQHPLFLGILKGSFVFLADLVRHLDLPLEVDFVRVESYGQGTVSSRRPRVLIGPRIPVQGRHVLVVEDIVDTGHTTAAVLRYLRRRRPASLRLCALLDKPERREVPVSIDYVGFTIPNRFVVGYGLDAAEAYRHLPEVYYLEEGSHGPEAAHRGGQG